MYFSCLAIISVNSFLSVRLGQLVFSVVAIHISFIEKKEEIGLSPMTKAPTPTEMSKGQHKQRNKKVRLNSGCGPT